MSIYLVLLVLVLALIALLAVRAVDDLRAGRAPGSRLQKPRRRSF